MPYPDFVVVAYCVLDHRRLLCVRKRGQETLILPGGKPEVNESDLEVLDRECAEELEVRPWHPKHLITVMAQAAHQQDLWMECRCYWGKLDGEPIANAEIESLVWVDIDSPEQYPLAPAYPPIIDAIKARL